MKIAFKNCNLIDGSEKMEVRKHQDVLVENGKIHAIGENLEISSDYTCIDCTDKYLMPGLINLHVHLAGSGAPKKKQADSVKAANLVMSHAITRKIGMKMVENFARTQLYSGVTTLRTMGGLGNFDALLRDQINAGKKTGPRLLVSNMAVSVPGGHMAGSVAYAAHDEKEAVEYVRKIAKDQPDWIKLMVTGGVLDAVKKGEPGILKMPPAIIKACCDEAHRLGLKVAAHAESSQGVMAALENGVDTIEHGADMDEKTIELYQTRKSCVICTISPALPIAKFGDDVMQATEMMRYNGDLVLNGIIESAKKALANGIPVGLGTDSACPFITQYDMWREVNYFHKMVGVSKSFALHTATLINARILGIDHETGSIEVGKSADLLITKQNPLDDLCHLRNPYLICMRGKLINNPKVKKYAKNEALLDKYA